MVALKQTEVDFIIIILAEHCLVALPVTVGAVFFFFTLLFKAVNKQQARYSIYSRWCLHDHENSPYFVCFIFMLFHIFWHYLPP